MRKFLFALMAVTLIVTSANAQQKQFKIGVPFTISLPDYMNQTVGINDAAVFQYKSEVKDVYGFVIEDNKTELKIAELNFRSIKEFYEDFIDEFIKGEEKLQKSTEIIKSVNGVNFLEADISFYDKEAETEIYYLIGMAETPHAYYKIISYSTLENKSKFKEDFRKILYSFRQ